MPHVPADDPCSGKGCTYKDIKYDDFANFRTTNGARLMRLEWELAEREIRREAAARSVVEVITACPKGCSCSLERATPWHLAEQTHLFGNVSWIGGGATVECTVNVYTRELSGDCGRARPDHRDA
jgi:hypothetical protein